MTGALEGRRIAQIAAGNLHSAALTTDGRVYTWGKNDFGQLGDGTFVNSTVPVLTRGGPHGGHHVP